MNYSGLIKSITGATVRLQENVAAVANQALVIRNWLVGAWLVEFEQNGKDRAKYGQKLLESVAVDLAKKEIKGLTDPRVLRDCRVLYRVYPQIRGSVTRELGTITLPPNTPETLTVTGKRIRGSATRELPTPLALQELMRLSWTHLQELIRLDDPWQRAFYENECIKGRWSIRQLQRQIGSLLYERTGLSTNKKAVIQRTRTQEPRQSISDVLRDPYILEFTGLAERTEYSELDLEAILLDHLQKFLLELGRGFCFEARQFRITEGRKHHRIDLVFYLYVPTAIRTSGLRSLITTTPSHWFRCWHAILGIWCRSVVPATKSEQRKTTPRSIRAHQDRPPSGCIHSSVPLQATRQSPFQGRQATQDRRLYRQIQPSFYLSGTTQT